MATRCMSDNHHPTLRQRQLGAFQSFSLQSSFGNMWKKHKYGRKCDVLVLQNILSKDVQYSSHSQQVLVYYVHWKMVSSYKTCLHREITAHGLSCLYNALIFLGNRFCTVAQPDWPLVNVVRVAKESSFGGHPLSLLLTIFPQVVGVIFLVLF